MNKINVDSAWEKLRGRIQEDELDLPLVEETRTRRLIPTVFKYAAAIIVLVGLGWFATELINTNGLEVQYADANEQGKEIVLPDGSSVVLNADSKISYPKEFKQNQRKVTLEGEAFFDVTKNPEKPFIIEAKDAEVRVLGTSFNVNASIPGYKVEVFVETGLVQLSRKMNGEEKILINPGNIGILNNEELSNQENTDKNIIAWKTKEIIFHEESLENVINTLNKVYKVNIDCSSDEVLNLRYTSTFRNQDIDSILNVICLTFNLKLDNTDDGINLVKYDS
jgi:ferric-dicitrate binding protein FerR (iron transport regulator)